MYPITTVTATQDHEFTDGDGTTPPTDLNAFWYNTIQRELLNVLSGAGITPNAAVFSQVWRSIVKVGIRSLYSIDNTVNVGSFAGATVVFHSASDFSITGTLNKNSLMAVIPMWGTDSPEYINFTYGGATVRIPKNNLLLGIANNEQNLQIIGIFVPLLDVNKVLSLTNIKANTLEYTNCIDKSLVSFTYDELDDAPEEWREWQFAEHWTLGQVKKVRCLNAGSSSGGSVGVPVFYDAESSAKIIKFYPEGYREFMCVGTRVSGDYTYAILAVNGSNA